MVNKPKRIGTAGESAVVRYARAHGFPLADRLTLSGRYDRGDVQLTVGAVLEVKAGKAAQAASYNQVLAWMADTAREQANAGADVSALVVQRRGYGTGRVEMWHFYWMNQFPLPMLACLTLADGLRMMRWSGWGEALERHSTPGGPVTVGPVIVGDLPTIEVSIPTWGGTKDHPWFNRGATP